MTRKLNRSSNIYNDQSGLALVLTLLLLTFMSVLGIAIMQNSAIEILIYGHSRQSAKAYQAGEACTNVTSRNFISNILAKTTVEDSDMDSECLYEEFQVSDPETPIGYEINDDAPKRFHGRTTISAWHDYSSFGTPSGAPTHSRKLVITTFQ